VGLGLADQSGGVGGGADADIAALAVGDDEQARGPCPLADALERCPARRAERLEAGELGLDRDAGRARALDQLRRNCLDGRRRGFAR
jgi:hypothetical protein